MDAHDELASPAAFPERELAFAVIAQAVSDMLDRPGNPALRRDRDEAFLFLTSTEQPWVRGRQFWSDMAGLDADAVRGRVQALLA